MLLHNDDRDLSVFLATAIISPHNHSVIWDPVCLLPLLTLTSQPPLYFYSKTIVSVRARFALLFIVSLFVFLGALVSPTITQSSSSSSSHSGASSFRLTAFVSSPLSFTVLIDGSNAAIHDSRKLKYPESACVRGTNPILAVELFDVLEWFRVVVVVELFDALEWLRAGEHFVGVNVPVDDNELLLELRDEPELFFILRRLASGAFPTSCSRNPSRAALWNALMVAHSCTCVLLKLPLFRLSTSGVTRGVAETALPCSHSLICSSCILMRRFGSTVKRPESKQLGFKNKSLTLVTVT